MARKFNDFDLRQLKRGDLVALIENQPDKWPSSSKGNFKRHKTNMEDMRWALLNCEFTTSLPLPLPAMSATLIANSAHIPPPPVEPVEDTGPPALPPAEGPVQSTSAGAATENLNNDLQVQVQGLPEHRSIHLLIEDTRRLFNERISQRIEASVINRENCKIGEWRASPMEVVSALQTSISAFQGPARVGVADEEDPEFTKFFGVIEEHEYLDSNDSSSHLLLIPTNGRLKLTIASIGGVKFPKPLRSESPPEPDRVAELLERAKARVKPASSAATGQSWLTEKAKAMEGFETFQKQHNQRLGNLDRVNYWKFAAKFSRTYFKVEWPVGIERSGGITIRKNALEAILNMKSTALNQAINMGRILEIHYDGPQKCAEVVKKIENEDNDTEPQGSELLANFLLQWDKNHPFPV
ncbi:hypothetical protein B0H13DRAFT_1891157 [Mycena leptocephala]|nr:hypothetical protein B0H13DRAFT_1891157 [Mycena leptocephala]